MELIYLLCVLACFADASNCVLNCSAPFFGATFSAIPVQLTPSVIAFLILLLAVAAMRIFELRISKKHQQDMTARGASKVKDPNFRWMALFHTLVLIGASAEVVFLHRPFITALAYPMIALFIFANIVRWWVIRTLGEHWN